MASEPDFPRTPDAKHPKIAIHRETKQLKMSYRQVWLIMAVTVPPGVFLMAAAMGWLISPFADGH